MVDGPHIHIQNRMMKPLAIALSGAGVVCGGGSVDGGGDLTNVHIICLSLPPNCVPRVQSRFSRPSLVSKSLCQ
jgi:hypothetical protein